MTEPDPRTRALPQINEHTVFSRPDAPWNRDATATTEIQRIAETSEEFSSSFQEERARANARSSDDSSLSELRDRLEFSQGLADDPNPPTEAVPDLLDNPELIEQRIQRLRAAASLLEEQLLGGKRVLTRREVAQLAGVSTVSAKKFWRALGLPIAEEGTPAFTIRDVNALAEMADLVARNMVDEETAVALARAIGQTTDRLVVWQMETVVEYLAESRQLDERQARAVALSLFEQILPSLEEVMLYAWKHNMANVFGRLNVNLGDDAGPGGKNAGQPGFYDSAMPLARGIGFVDLVSFTRLSQQMEPRQLASLVKRFQALCYNIVTAGGGRVIKTVGDEVFFAAETPRSGAEISVRLMERITEDPDLPKARVGFSWGKVLSRLGDIFGSTVNLAARLTSIGEPGTVTTDWETSSVIAQTEAYEFSNRRTVSLQGLGDITIVDMHRGQAPRMVVDVEP